VEHVQPLDRAFPWRRAALAAGALALAELVALLALAGISLFHAGAAPARPGSTAARTTARRPARQALPLRPRSRLAVLVLNGNGVAHAAGDEAARLLGRGYRRAEAADAGASYARSLVLFRPGFLREARRLAADAGVRAVAPLDGRLPAADARYQLVLILGRSPS